MLDDLDDALVCLVFSFLTPTEVMLTTALLSRRFSDLSADNAIWRPQCKRRWRGLRRCEAWMKETEVAASAALNPLTLPLRLRRTWCSAFATKLESIRPRLGIFAMRSNLQIGRAFGIHFFEPRYRWLVRRTMDPPVGTPELFIYCPKMPEAGDVACLCEMHDVDVAPDGQANLRILPVAHCRIVTVYEEEVPNNPQAPRLMCAQVEELPTGWNGDGEEQPGDGSDSDGSGGGGGGGGGVGNIGAGNGFLRFLLGQLQEQNPGVPEPDLLRYLLENYGQIVGGGDEDEDENEDEDEQRATSQQGQ